MDELSKVQQLLAEPPPEPEVVEAARLRLERAALGGIPLRTRAAASGWQAAGLARRGAGSRRWSGWLAPVAAAVAVAGVIIASLAISGVLLRSSGSGTANSSGAFAKVPRYFVALPQTPGRAVVGATATGAVLGTVTPPKAYPVFLWAAAAGDGRTFVLAAGVRPAPGTSVTDPRPVTFYRLTLSRSGHPGRLVLLPIPRESVTITGLALSPDGSKFAVALLPVRGRDGAMIQVFSLATGAGRQWAWPAGHSWIGVISPGVGISGAMSWEADNRTLLFEETTRTGAAWIPQLRLLDAATPGGSLLTASTRVPIPSAELGTHGKNVKVAPFRIVGVPLITGDGTKLFALAYRQASPPKVFGFSLTSFSVRTGKPVQVLYRQRTGIEANSPAPEWVNTSGTAMIAERPAPGQSSKALGTVFGVQTPSGFTPFPPGTQHLISRHNMLPVW